MTDFFKVFKLNFRYIIAFMSLIACTGILAVLAFHEIPKGNETLFVTLATLFFASTVQKQQRALFPDKEDVKNDKKPT